MQAECVCILSLMCTTSGESLLDYAIHQTQPHSHIHVRSGPSTIVVVVIIGTYTYFLCFAKIVLRRGGTARHSTYTSRVFDIGYTVNLSGIVDSSDWRQLFFKRLMTARLRSTTLLLRARSRSYISGERTRHEKFPGLSLPPTTVLSN